MLSTPLKDTPNVKPVVLLQCAVMLSTPLKDTPNAKPVTVCCSVL